MKKAIVIILALTIFSASQTLAASKVTSGQNTNLSVTEIVTKSTPNFVNNLIGSSVKILENIRLSAVSFSDKNIVISQKNVAKNTKTGNFFKVLNYLELYLLIFLSFICKTVIIFYCCLALVLFYILRFIWRLIF